MLMAEDEVQRGPKSTLEQFKNVLLTTFKVQVTSAQTFGTVTSIKGLREY